MTVTSDKGPDRVEDPPFVVPATVQVPQAVIQLYYQTGNGRKNTWRKGKGQRELRETKKGVLH